VVIRPRLVYESRPAVRRRQSGRSSGPRGLRAADGEPAIELI